MSIGDKLLKSAVAGGLTPSENFKTVTYTGNSSSQAITGVGFKPDLVWIKERSQAENHNWIDSTRGTSNILASNSTAAQFTSTTEEQQVVMEREVLQVQYKQTQMQDFP